jgi:hypothetical protein
VSERIRTADRLDHNQELYQLSYAHQAMRKCSSLLGCSGGYPLTRTAY